MNIDLTATPFSRAGSWMNIAILADGNHAGMAAGLYLRQNRARPGTIKELFQLQLIQSGVPVPFTTRADPGCLYLIADDGSGSVEIIYDGPDSLRLRGLGAGLQLTVPTSRLNGKNTGQFCVVYRDHPSTLTVNLRFSLRRYVFEALAGSVSTTAQWDSAQSSSNVSVLLYGETDWEVAMDEVNSTWVERQRDDWQTCRQRATQEVNSYLDAFPQSPDCCGDWGRYAAWLLWTCTKPTGGFLHRQPVYMSLNHMDQVWSWDNLFNAAALARAHPSAARDQLMLFFDFQDEFGACPDGLNDFFMHYNFSKPPVHAILIRWIMRNSPEALPQDFMRELYPKLAKFTRWWLNHRRMKGQDLCHYLHGNDSGWDNGTVFRDGVPLLAPDLNAFLIIQCRFLGELSDQWNLSESAKWYAEAARLETALYSELWNGSECVGKRLPGGELVETHSLIPAMVLLLGKNLPAEIRDWALSRLNMLTTDWGLATEWTGSNYYKSDGYWRGPIWGPSQMLAVIGLIECGEIATAKAQCQRYVNLCIKSGFAENFDAISGWPLRDRGYTWTASAFLELSQLLLTNNP